MNSHDAPLSPLRMIVPAPPTAKPALPPGSNAIFHRSLPWGRGFCHDHCEIPVTDERKNNALSAANATMWRPEFASDAEWCCDVVSDMLLACDVIVAWNGRAVDLACLNKFLVPL